MSELTNEGQELFCQNVAEGANHKDAYVKAGYKDSKYTNRSAHIMYLKPHIQERIKELQKENRLKSEYKLEEALNALAQIARNGSDGQVISAINSLSKINGWNDVTKIKMDITKNVDSMTDEELIEMINQE